MARAEGEPRDPREPKKVVLFRYSIDGSNKVESIKVRLRAIKTPTQDQVVSMAEEFKEASKVYYEQYRGPAVDTSYTRSEILEEEANAKALREEKVNAQRRVKAKIYSEVLRMLGQGHIVDEIATIERNGWLR